MNYRHIERAKKIIGREKGTIHKDWGGKLPIALIWPNTYRLGMSSLALHALYQLFNDEPDVVCERLFWGYQKPPRPNEPVISLESQRILEEFAAIACTISYEMDYFNLVYLLRRAGFPLFAADRDENWPLLIGGGPALYTNPEPLAEIFDLVAIGEAEVIVPPLVDALWEVGHLPRPEAYARLAELDGLYIPALNNGPVERVWLRNLASRPALTQIYTDETEFGDRTLIEIARGCGRGCRFCMAGYGYRPMRELPLDAILGIARHTLKHRERIGLVSAAVSDHSQIDRIAIELRQMGAALSASSMRVDPLSQPLIQALAESGNQTLTIAPEAGSERLRRVINKPQTDEQIFQAVEWAARYDFPRLKLYFMVGQPTETEADVAAIAEMALQARRLFPRHLAINATPYVPKSHTAFQWMAMASIERLERRIKYLEERLTGNGVTVRSDSPAWAAIEGCLARGDRRLSRVLARMKKTSLREWQRALQAEGLSQADYLRERSLEEPLPWQSVSAGVAQGYFRRERRRAQGEELTAPCPPAGCLKCNVCDEAWAFDRPA